MGVSLIGTRDTPYDYTKYTIMKFPDWRSLERFAMEIKKTRSSGTVETANNNFRTFVETQLNGNQQQTASYGLFGKHPKSYKEAMERNKFIYYDEYKRIKQKVEKIVAEKLQKNSTADVMKPRLVYNDKQIGEFIFDKAAMALAPEIFYYSPSKKRKVDILNEKIIQDGEKIKLASDKSPVVFAFEITKEDGSVEYMEIKGEDTLQKANEKGIVSCTSTNKKVFLYKEKKPKLYNSVKIIVGMTAGGFTGWINDFYTGLTAAIVVDVLEGLGYSVDVEVAMGGGRCGGCGRKLMFDGELTHGRRFFMFTAKSFNEPLDMDGLLYTLCDPSFHNVKFISLLNYFFKFFGDQLDTNASPAGTWHGVQEEDLVNPIGMYEKKLDHDKGNNNLIHFYILGYSRFEDKKINSENRVIQAVTDLVLECENINLKAIKKYQTHDFGID